MTSKYRLAAVLALVMSSPAFASPSSDLRVVADRAFAWRQAADPDVRVALGLPLTHIGRISRADEQAYSVKARELHRMLAVVPADGLTAAEAELRQSLLQDLAARSHAAENYWYDFLVTPYRGGDIHSWASAGLAAAALSSAADRSHYLALLEGYAAAVDAIGARTREQRAHGNLLPKAAIPNARALIDEVIATLPTRIGVGDRRLDGVSETDRSEFRRAIAAAGASRLLPALARLRAVLDDSYFNAAPSAVGLAQYRGGAERYARCIAAGTGLTLDPATIRTTGERALASIEARRRELRTRLGGPAEAAAFDGRLRGDPKWLAATADDVAARYRRYLARIAPILPNLFAQLPKAPYDVKRLDPADEGGMAYGDYQSPNAASPTGFYRFNGSGLAKRTMIGAQHLIAHELVPGHHLQIALAREIPQVHPIVAYLDPTPFVEGWAEYAAWLVEDQGLYEPAELYGHLSLQSFLAARLVTDTGLNTAGWGLGQARAFMSRYTLEAPAQIDSETLRYATDIPCQAIGYYLGYQAFRDARNKAEAALGPRFDVKRFHSAMLAGGAVPLNLLAARVDRYIAGERSSATSHVSALSRTSILIDRPAVQIWPVLLDRSRWMPDTVATKTLRGVEGATGWTYLYSRRAGVVVASRLEEILLADPGRRLVLRLADPDTGVTNAYVDQRLTAEGNRTRLDFEMYWFEDVPGSKSAAELDAMRADYSSQTVAKIDAGLARLKHAAEAPAP
ncbi:MAG: DUF885 family protein [Pseudomonadota bacterium]|jgi:uncharacterized protein (DUF885 family)